MSKLVDKKNMSSTSHLYAPVSDPKDLTTLNTQECIASPPRGNPKYHSRTQAEKTGKAWIALGAFLLLLMIFALEITGAVYAFRGHNTIPTDNVL